MGNKYSYTGSSALDMENNFGLSNSSYYNYGSDRVTVVESEYAEQETDGRIQDLFTASVTAVSTRSFVMPAKSRNFREAQIPQGVMPSFGFPIKARRNTPVNMIKPMSSTQRGISISSSASDSGPTSKDDLLSKVGMDSEVEDSGAEISMDEAKEKALEKLKLEKELEAEIQKQKEKKKKDLEEIDGDIDGVNLFSGVLGFDDEDLPESVKHVDIEDSLT